MKKYFLSIALLASSTGTWAVASASGAWTAQDTYKFTESNADVQKEDEAKAGCPFETYAKAMNSGKTVTFVKRTCFSSDDFSNVKYSWKPEQALLQNKYALTEADRRAITPEDFKNMTQEEVDQIYIRSTSGPIKAGEYKGSIVFHTQFSKKIQDTLERKILSTGRLGAAMAKLAETHCKKDVWVECLGELLWKGKKIYAPTADRPEYLLKNGIGKTAAVAVNTALQPWNKLIQSNWQLAGTKESFNGDSRYMLFPAKVYCGQSLFDHRRESIVIDYAFGSDFEHIENLDDLAGRNGFDVRDEIRMVRPGVYVGRAYLNKIFVLNFVLENSEQEKAAQNLNSSQWETDQCFNGTTTR